MELEHSTTKKCSMQVGRRYFLEIILSFWTRYDKKDEVVWWRDKGEFSLKNCYIGMSELSASGSSIDEDILKGLNVISKLKIPNRFQVVFGCSSVERFATKVELTKRGILFGTH